MKCPFCGHEDTQVRDSRSSDDGNAIRRRRACPACGSRFTTYERAQLRDLTVVKANGQQRPFDRDKVLRSIQIATRKRPVTSEQVEEIASQISRKLELSGESEVKSSEIGERVMEELQKLDKVAYIRYASVYRNFREAEDFGKFAASLNEMIEKDE
jgi:transcriptional repressor NrdR